MDPKELEYLVSLVTRQVMDAMTAKAPAEANTEGFDKVLVLGKPEGIPEALTRRSVLLDVSDYECNRNVLRYDRLVITQLTITQLTDIATARISDATTCAVIHALLNGVEVYMLEQALGFRKFAGKGNGALYNLLEQHVRTAQIFGVKLYQPISMQVLPEAKPAKFVAPPVQVPQGSAKPNSHRLITEAEALELVSKAGSVPEHAIITPSARDILAKAGLLQ